MSEATTTLGGDTIVMFQVDEFSENNQKQVISRFERDGKSVMSVKNVPVFRSGTFRDSIGYQHEFDDFAMEQMVRNYDHLKAQKIFADVPVRNGHPSPFRSRMQELVGYVVAMRTDKRTAPHDGNEYTYLIADFEILDSDAQKNVDSGLWRNRSSEIGTYVDNRENEYGPAFLGVAYVDIPAVEGLNGFSKSDTEDNVHFIMEDQKMSGVPTPPKPGNDKPFAFSLGGQTGITDLAAVQEYINKIETERDDFSNKVNELTTERDSLAQFKANLVDAERSAFVTSLIDDGKVLASQKDSLIALAKALPDDQFETWKGSYEHVGKQDILGNHGNQGSTKPNSGSETDEDKAKAEFEDNKIIVRALCGRMTEDKVKETAAYKAVIAHDPTFTL